MAFAKIPMSFDDVRANYKKSTKEELPGEIVEQLRKWNEGIDEKAISPEGKIVCSWAKVSGAPKPTIETFTRKDGGNSETAMDGPSNNYGWLTAKRLPDD
jgi:hypothetical protein